MCVLTLYLQSNKFPPESQEIRLYLRSTLLTTSSTATSPTRHLQIPLVPGAGAAALARACPRNRARRRAKPQLLLNLPLLSLGVASACFDGMEAEMVLPIPLAPQILNHSQEFGPTSPSVARFSTRRGSSTSGETRAKFSHGRAPRPIATSQS